MPDTDDWSDARLAAEVRRFVFDDSAEERPSPIPQPLRDAGERVHGPVLELLADESIRNRLTERSGGVMICESPYDRACDLLGDAPPDEAASRLDPFFVYPMQSVRAQAARMYGKIATEEALPLLRQAFRDLDERMAVAAIEGLAVAARLGRIPGSIAQEVFEEVRAIHESCPLPFAAPRILLAIDRERAVEQLASEARWQSPPDWFEGALSALFEAGVLVPRDRLIHFIGRLEPGGDLHPKDRLLARTLPLLGAHRDPRDLVTLERLLDGPDDWLVQGASEGLLAYHGLPDLGACLDRKPVDSLTRPEVWYEAIHSMDGLVGNGGFSYYFNCAQAAEWQMALEALEAMGFVERVSIARSALELLGDEPLKSVRDPAGSRLRIGRCCEEHEQALNELAHRWYDSLESILAKSTRYVVAHAEDFR